MTLKLLLKKAASLSQVLVRSVERHGGGVAGATSVGRRAWNVLRALGFRGFIARLSGAQRQLRTTPIPTGFNFPASRPLTYVDFRVGVMVHLFYGDLAVEFAQLLRAVPVNYVLLVSVVDEDTEAIARQAFSGLPNLIRSNIKRVANRGRDLAPLFVDFRDEVLGLDLVAHIHTKKSLYTGSEQTAWRRHLTQSLFGTQQRTAWILGMFSAEPSLGIVYPESFSGIPAWGHTWLGNLDAARLLGQRLSLKIEPGRYFDFPAGSMFWARVDALRPILELRLSADDFPIEQGQTDGTLQHALERLLVLVTRQQGFISGILPQDGSLRLSDEASRNWESAFQDDMSSKFRVAALGASIVSLDIFDTLVTRPFLFPSGARDFLATVVDKATGISNFASLRELAEERARLQLGHDPTLDTIYDVMQKLEHLPESLVQSIKNLELRTEARTLKPRLAVIEAATRMKISGMRMVAVSDMYLSSEELQHILPAQVASLPEHWYISCETHQRKDEGSTWSALPAKEAVPVEHWRHVGDNEYADIQMTQSHQYLHPVHVIRPNALLDLVPSLHPLRPRQGDATHWQDQLLLGLLANHLADLSDRSPDAFGQRLKLPTPHAFGYLVLGPLLTDYTAWLMRLALERGADQVLFIAREGYLLHQAFLKVRETCTPAAELRGDYLLASRRSVGMASLMQTSDVTRLFGSTFTGKLNDLIRARMGQEAAQIVQSILGSERASQEIFLPEMQLQLKEMLAPCIDQLLVIAARERDTYQEYWQSVASGSQLLLSDIGYAGTIQKHLSRLTGQAFAGAYFGVNEGISADFPSGSTADARYYDAREDSGQLPAPAMRHNLLLETMLTAPNGQLLRFIRNERSELHPEFAPHDVSSTGLKHILEVQRGALDFVSAVCHVAQEQTVELSFDKTLSQTPLDCFGDGKWVGDASWLEDMGVLDDYTGRGLIGQSPC